MLRATMFALATLALAVSGCSQSTSDSAETDPQSIGREKKLPPAEVAIDSATIRVHDGETVVALRGTATPNSTVNNGLTQTTAGADGKWAMRVDYLAHRDTISVGAYAKGLVMRRASIRRPTRRLSASERVAAAKHDAAIRRAASAAVRKEPEMTSGQANALRSAESYLDLGGMSKDGLILQLSSAAGEGYSKADATFAANHVDADWNEEAVQAAKAYLKMMGMSKTRLIDQLSSPAGDKFTEAQARYAANQVY